MKTRYVITIDNYGTKRMYKIPPSSSWEARILIATKSSEHSPQKKARWKTKDFNYMFSEFTR